ncbi:MAG: Inner-membrane translocator [Thermotoga sp. 50_1627]|nr:MAG: Inner-membrane translocator [Thermotoga sp. 50_64]KUK24182.1 MAG: Inner-membrane translocator [Thermotoga sp. 50_1627]
MKSSRIFRLSQEAVVGILLLVICAVVGVFSPSFISFATLFEMVRGSLAFAIMGLGVLPVLIAGEVNLSFCSVAAFSAFATHHLLLRLGYQGGIGMYLILSGLMGSLAGWVMGVIVTRFKLRVFPVSLGFWMFWYGMNLFVISPIINFTLPPGLVGYYSRYIVTVQDPVIGVSGLHEAIIYLLAMALLMWFFLRYTMMGRGLYAVGGNREVAVRIGYNVGKILTIALVLSGALSGIAGVIQCSFYRYFTPTLFRGQELSVLTAVVIGGASLEGGRGSVLGTILGVFFIQVVTRSLVYLGVKGEYQQFVLGLMLIIFFVASSIKRKPRPEKMAKLEEDTQGGR